MSLRLFLCGDVMTGRGIDQALPHHVNPILYEPYVRDAREYVHLAEKAHGSISQPLSLDHIWGDAPQELERTEVAEPASGGQPLQSNEYDRSGKATRRGWATQPPAAEAERRRERSRMGALRRLDCKRNGVQRTARPT